MTVQMNIKKESPQTPAASPIVDLRRLLRERFPEAHDRAAPGAAAFPSGAPAALSCLEGAAPGTITEVVSPRPSAGSGLLIQGLLQGAAERKQYVALVDGRDVFDPQSTGLEACEKFLWARCQSASQAVKATDLLLRDGNIGLVAMDLQLTPLRELGRLPSSSWHRLRGLAEKSGANLIALTPRRIVPSAHLRVELDGTFGLDAFDLPREELHNQLFLRVLRSRGIHSPPTTASPETPERKAG